MLPVFEYASSLFDQYELELSHEIYEKLEVYAAFLVEYNEKINLTAITEPIEILKKHFIDSILLQKYVELPLNCSMIDVGTGAGFPSIPINILRPDIHLTLLDSLKKRTVFLQELCDRLGISAQIIHGRAEDISNLPEYREKYNISCARAVANMSVLSELCLPFVAVRGKFVAMKGPNEDIYSSQNAITLLGGEISSLIEYDLFDERRKIVSVKKISQTPTKYPRNSARIKKYPL